MSLTMKESIEKSNRVILRYTQKEDINFVLKAEQDSDNSPYVGQWTKEEHLKSLLNTDIIHLIIDDFKQNKKIGYAILAGINNENKSIELKRIVVIDKGKGFGKEFLNLIKKLVFERLNAHRLWLDVREFNERAQNVYKSEGFNKEGVLRECILYNEKFVSLIVMSILEKEYKNSN